jgi:hypothetical protein
VKQKKAAPFPKRRGFLLPAARRHSGGRRKDEDREEEHDLCSAERDQRGSE